MTGRPRVAAEWLALRERADARARSTDLVARLRRTLRPVPAAGRVGSLVVHDLGGGTGSMMRWLAPLLPGPQHWVLHDRDADLLATVDTQPKARDADGALVTVESRRGDVTRLPAREVAGADLVTASALLDLLTGAQLERLVATCVRAGCPALVTLSVTGRVSLDPDEPLDAIVGAAFDAHQQRVLGGHRLLGPRAVDAAVDAFARHGLRVTTAPSPWRLGPAEAELTAAWFDGWLGAARTQDPGLTGRTRDYARRRRQLAATGRLSVTVEHRDLLAYR